MNTILDLYDFQSYEILQSWEEYISKYNSQYLQRFFKIENYSTIRYHDFFKKVVTVIIIHSMSKKEWRKYKQTLKNSYYPEKIISIDTNQEIKKSLIKIHSLQPTEEAYKSLFYRKYNSIDFTGIRQRIQVCPFCGSYKLLRIKHGIYCVHMQLEEDIETILCGDCSSKIASSNDHYMY